MFVTVDDLLSRLAIHPRIPTVGERNSCLLPRNRTRGGGNSRFQKPQCGLLNSQTTAPTALLRSRQDHAPRML